MLNRLRSSLARLHKDEPGQGMVEYLLILALVSFLAVAGTRNLATGLDNAVTKVSTVIGQYIGAADNPGNPGGHGHRGHHGGQGGHGNNGNHGNGNNGNHGNGNNGNHGGNSGH